MIPNITTTDPNWCHRVTRLLQYDGIYRKISWIIKRQHDRKEKGQEKKTNSIPQGSISNLNKIINNDLEVVHPQSGSQSSTWFLVELKFGNFERGKPEYPEKNLSEHRRERTTNSNHIKKWRYYLSSTVAFTWRRPVEKLLARRRYRARTRCEFPLSEVYFITCMTKNDLVLLVSVLFQSFVETYT